MTPFPDAWSDRLSEYVDGELDARDREALDAHLMACERCRADLARLRAIVATAQALPDRPPAADLWPGVEAGIRRSRREGRRFSFTLPQLVAAGLALMLLSGGMVWLARIGGARTELPPAAARVVPANFADAAYDEAIGDLERTLQAGRARLDPRTARILDANLRSIDEAVAQCRQALEADPANGFLNTYLAQARSRKLELLRRAAALIDKSS
jgi:anti-sigma factor RsiW